MAVEVVFWFHPLVWWLGARLMEEREQACDEEVLRNGGEPRVYAEGILKICELYLASPLACVAGVTGGDLKRRIEAIMANRVTYRLKFGRRLLLAAAGLSAVAGPILIGAFSVLQSRAQSSPGVLTFEVASIKPADRDPRQMSIGVLPGGNFRAVNVSLNQLITWSYNIRCGKDCGNYLSGGPGWASSQRFDILAKPAQPEATTDQRVLQDQARQRLRALLTERFQLRIRQETKEMPVFALVVMKNGHKPCTLLHAGTSYLL
jgi:hypothetical protein